ncbi:MAG: DASS family sodium-coupled anion symporter [Balneolales bacterium]
MSGSIVGLSPFKFAGLCVGIVGFLLCLILPIPGLYFAGKVTLGIFVMAAVFWMTEPVPIFATSMLVIFLQVLFLSAQGPLFQNSTLPTYTPIHLDGNEWRIANEAITEEGIIIILENGRQMPVLVDSYYSENGQVVVNSNSLNDGLQIVADVSHRRAAYQPNSYTDFFGTLANPIIILFLGGFMLAAAAVKYSLDKNITRYLLQPFGERPLPILFGLMLITAILSAFMSNTATTAMMMTVIIPITAQLKSEDLFKTALALSIPVAANIGGIATPIGTPPNAIALAAMTKSGAFVSFTDWMMMATPLVVIVLFISWLLLYKLFPPLAEKINMNSQGGFLINPKAITLYVLFAITVLLWITENLHGISSNIVAFLPISGFVLVGILDKDDIRSLPWEVLWLVAGGISLGISMGSSGLAEWMINSIPFGSFGLITVIVMFSITALMMSNFLSNTVTATLLMPLAISLVTSGALGTDFSLIILGLVISISCSLAMVLPISTPPNAIAMSTGLISTPDMARSGIIIGLIGIMIVISYALIYWPLFI